MVSKTIVYIQIISTSTLGRNLNCIQLYFISSLAWASLLPSSQINQRTSSWSIRLMFSFSYFKNISLSVSYCYTVNSLEESNIFSKFPGGISKALKSVMSLIYFFHSYLFQDSPGLSPALKEKKSRFASCLGSITTVARETA